MADQSFAILQKKANRRHSHSNVVMGLSNSFVDDGNKSSSSAIRNSLDLKSMDSTRIRGAEIIDTNQEHKKRCFEKLMVRTERMAKENVEDVKCSLQVEVIDDTALIEATAAVSGFKNSHKKEIDLGSGNVPKNLGGSRNLKQENDGKKKRNKGSKKQGKVPMKMKEKKLNVQVVEDQNAKEKKISDRKRQNGFKKAYPKMKVVYRRKDSKDPKPEAIDVQETGETEHPKVETEIEPEEIVTGSFQEPDLNPNPNASNEIEKELTVELEETEPVIEKDDGVDSNPKKNEEEEDENVSEITTEDEKGLKKYEEEDENVSEIATNGDEIGLKKMAYTKEEIEALRFVNEDEQKNKWTKIYDGFSPTVAKEYMSLLSDMIKPQPQRYNRVANFGSTSTSTSNRHTILSMPPVLPMCSSSSYKKIAPYGHTNLRVNFP